MLNISPVHLFVALLVATIAVILPMGDILMAIPWLVVVAIACKRESRRGRGIEALATYVVVTSVVVIAAILAPVKTTERLLDTIVVLPRTELALSEMDREKNFENTQWLPRYIYINAHGESANKRIRFRARGITLREFVQTIETQSSLRHHFGHCGNCSSILYGGSCTFGLAIR